MTFRPFAGALVACLALSLACGSPPVVEAPAPAEPSGPLVVFLGDSLTAGYGLEEGQAFPALISEALAAAGEPIRLINAGVSGDTSAGGLSRIDWLLRQRPDVVVVALGANDGLRGQPLEGIESNLRAIVERCQEAGARVLIAGMEMPPSHGPEYTAGFRALYGEVATATGVALLPFLLEGVGGEPELNLADGIHPNVEGHQRIADTVLPALRRVLAGL
ncbi:MAG: arylesterase [Acidobacteriota bacterium]